MTSDPGGEDDCLREGSGRTCGVRSRRLESVGVQPAAKPPRRRFLPASAGIVLFVLGAVFGLLFYESVSKLWGDQDSPVWIYVVYGAVAFALALACFWAAVQSLR